MQLETDHPLFGRLLPQRRRDLRMPSLPTIPDDEIDYVLPPWPLLGSRKLPDVVRDCLTAYRAAVASRTGAPCRAYQDGLTRSQTGQVMAVSKILRAAKCSPWAWSHHRVRILISQSKWDPTIDPTPPPIQDIYAIGAAKSPPMLKGACRATCHVPWIRGPAGMRLGNTLELAGQQLARIMRYERITQAELDRAADIMTAEILKLAEENRQWKFRRYALDNLKIAEGEWIWS